MKFNKILLGLLCISMYSCSEDTTLITEETIMTEFIPDEVEMPNILDDYPEGRIAFSYNGEDKEINRASAFSTGAETLIITEFVDNNGDVSKLIIGIKGFSEGAFKGNVLGYGLLPSDYDLADINITEYGDIGEPISGNFSVEYDELGTTISVSGEFNGLRIK